MNSPEQLQQLQKDIRTLAQAMTDGMVSLALVIARTTDKGEVLALLFRYSEALRESGENLAGAALVTEMARVVGEIQDGGHG